MSDPSALPSSSVNPRSRCAPPGNGVHDFQRTHSHATLPTRHAAPVDTVTVTTTIVPANVPQPQDLNSNMNPRHSRESAVSDEADAASSGSGSRASPDSNSRFRFNASFNRRQQVATPNPQQAPTPNRQLQYQEHYQQLVPNSPASSSSARLRTTSSFYNARTQIRPPTSYRSAARRIYGNPALARSRTNNEGLLDDVASLNGDDDTGSVRSRRATLDSSAARSSFGNNAPSRFAGARNHHPHHPSSGPQKLDAASLRRLQSAGTRLPPHHSRSFYNSTTSTANNNSNSSSSRLQVTSSFHNGIGNGGVNPRTFAPSAATTFTYAPRADRGCNGGNGNGSYRRLPSARRGVASSSIDSEVVSFDRALPPLLPRRSSLERVHGGARSSAASDIRHSAESVKAQLSSLFVGGGNGNSNNRPPMPHQYPEHGFRRRASVCASSSGNNGSRQRGLFGRGRRAGAPATNNNINTNTSFHMGSPSATGSMRSRDVVLDLQSIADEHVVEYDYSPVTTATGVH